VSVGTRRQPRARATLAALALVAAVAVGACDAPAPTVAPTPTRAPEATPTTTVYELATDVWYEGLVLHVGQATTVLDARGGTIEVYATIENPEPEPSSLDAAISLTVGGTRVEPTRDSQVPTIPGGESRLALFTFELQEIGSAADAVLEIGAEPSHVAKVPFTEAAGAPVVFRPIDLELRGSGAAGDLRLALKRAVVRWDLPDWSEQLPAGKRAITITYDASYTGSFSGGFAFTGENVALRLPGGDVVEARRDGHSQSVELIGAGKTKRDLFSRFEIPAGAKGEFALLVRVGSSERAIRFTIEG
jgi:hypothetical protein